MLIRLTLSLTIISKLVYHLPLQQLDNFYTHTHTHTHTHLSIIMRPSFCALGLLTAVQAAAVPSDNTNLAARTHDKKSGSPFAFTSTYSVLAKPENVVDAANNFTGGLQGSSGTFNFGINSNENVICYNITITGFRGDYQSPAKSATHIHEAAVGRSGPPR